MGKGGEERVVRVEADIVMEEGPHGPPVGQEIKGHQHDQHPIQLQPAQDTKYVGTLVRWYVGILVCLYVGILVCWYIGMLVIDCQIQTPKTETDDVFRSAFRTTIQRILCIVRCTLAALEPLRPNSMVETAATTAPAYSAMMVLEEHTTRTLFSITRCHLAFIS